MTGSNGRAAPRRRRHPYRDTALIYGVFAVVVLAIAIATGGNAGPAAIAAALAFLAATGWHWRAIRKRGRESP